MLQISAETIQACRRGDAGAFEDLVRATQRSVFSTVFRIVGNREDAADVTQEVYLRVWRNIRGFHADAAFPAWLQRIATNAAISHMRRRGWLSEPMDPEDLPGSVPGPDDAGEIVSADEVESALARLPATYRVVLVMKEMYGFSVEEVARELGSTPGAIKVRLFRARNRLARELAAGGTVVPFRRGKATS